MRRAPGFWDGRPSNARAIDLGDAIGKEVAAIAGPRPLGTQAQVVDLFAGSCNTLYWLLRHLPG